MGRSTILDRAKPATSTSRSGTREEGWLSNLLTNGAENASITEWGHLEKHRQVLRRDLSGLTTEALDWKLMPSMITMGTSVLHMAALEFLLVSAVSRPKAIGDSNLWEKVKAGFHLDLGCEESTGKPLDYYLEVLDQVRARTAQCLQDIDLSKVHVSSFERTLRDLGLEGDMLERMTRKINMKVMAMTLEVNKGFSGIETLQIILQHESYHRGQLTLQKYLFNSSK